MRFSDAHPHSVTATAAPSSARTSPSAASTEGRPLRLGNSIVLPFWVAVAAFGLVSLVTAATVGRAGLESRVPAVILQYQQGLTVELAQNVRRGLNEGLADLTQSAAAVDALTAPTRSALEATAAIVTDVHDRYDLVFVTDAEGGVLAQVGDGQPQVLDRPVPQEPTILPIRQEPDGRLPLIQQIAPLADGGAVVGHYDPAFLRFALESAGTGDAWVVDRQGRILGSTAGFLPFAKLEGASLRRAARLATDGAPGVWGPSRGARGDVVAWAPATGDGPAGRLGLSVVTRRPAGTFSLPSTDARRQGLVVAVLGAALTVALFSWIWLVVISPVRRLRLESARVAGGDLSLPVAILRYDEIGLASRALDRLRILLVGARVAPAPRSSSTPLLGRRPSTARQLVVAAAIVAGLAVFLAALVAITEIGGRPEVGAGPVNATGRTAATTTPSLAEDQTAGVATVAIRVEVEPSACERSSDAIVYRATLRHGEPGQVTATIDVVVSAPDGTTLAARRSEQVLVASGVDVPLAVRLELPPGTATDDAICVVRAVEVAAA